MQGSVESFMKTVCSIVVWQNLHERGLWLSEETNSYFLQTAFQVALTEIELDASYK